MKLNGWAVESRLYAEDPYRNFLPSIGRLSRYRPPAETCLPPASPCATIPASTRAARSPVLRPDDRQAVHPWRPTARAAIDDMRDGARQFRGRRHRPQPAVSVRPDDASALAFRRITTAFIAEEYPDGFKAAEPDAQAKSVFAAVALSMEAIRKDRLDHLPGRLRPHSGNVRTDWAVKLDDEVLAVKLVEGYPTVPVEMDVKVADGAVMTLTGDWAPGEVLWSGTVDGEPVNVQVRAIDNGWRLDWQGFSVSARVMSPRIAELDALMPEKIAPDTSKLLLCPMPGLVVSLHVAEGDEVSAGQQLAIVEAMKMENVLRAERDCTVTAINAAPGDSLAVDAVIMEFD